MALNSVQALVKAEANRAQELEDAMWVLYAALSDPTLLSLTGDLLDKVGARVGELRGGRNDADYLAAIRIRIRVNRSRGRAEDVIAVAVLASVNSAPLYNEYYPASFMVTAANLPSGNQVANLLGRAKAAGTYGVLVFSPPSVTGMTWGDASGGGTYAANQKWSDTVSGLPANKWMSAQATPKPPGT